MRILLTFHGPLEWSNVALHVRHVGQVLRAAGHDVRLITAGAAESEDLDVARRIVPLTASGPALATIPQYAVATPGESSSFERLSDAALADYRQAFREAIDDEIDRWNPDILHIQHVAVHAQLALESGAPYVATAWGPELDVAGRDNRFRHLVEQAAENAGRILVGSDELRRRLAILGEGIDERVELLTTADVTAARLISTYQAVLDERFGH